MLASKAAQIAEEMKKAIKEFDAAVPMLPDMRNVAEQHVEDTFDQFNMCAR